MIASLLVLAAPFVQAGAPPILGPSGGPIQIVDVSLVGGATQILTKETVGGPFGFQFHIYGADAQGTLSWESTLPDETVVRDVHAISGDLVICRDGQNVPRVLERVGATWVPGAQLQGSAVIGQWITARRFVDTGGSKVAHHFPGTSEVSLQDVSVPSAPVTELTIPDTSTGAFLDLAVDQDLLVVAWGLYDVSAPGFTNVIVRVFENTPGAGWTEQPSLQPPTGVDWTNKFLAVDTDADRIAVANGVCGEVFIYERSAGGGFALADSAVSTRALELSPGVCALDGRVLLRGDDLVLVTGVEYAGERFSRTASGWVAEEIVLGDEGAYGGYWFAGDFLVSTAGGHAGNRGIQSHARTDQPAGVAISCPATASTEPSFLRVFGLGTFAQSPILLSVSAIDLTGSQYLAYGFESGFRPLGPESTLCIGGPIRVASLIPQSSQFFSFDPGSSGLAAGSTVHFQGWQRVPTLPSGRTTNALAVTFAP